jgi:hypothetical protein
MTATPCSAHAACTAAGSREPSSTTTIGDFGQLARTASRHRARRAGRSRVGTTTVSADVGASGAGYGDSTPASSGRRARARRAGRSPTVDGAPHSAIARAPSAVRRSTRSGVPPTRTRPRSSTRTFGCSATASSAGGGDLRFIGPIRGSSREPGGASRAAARSPATRAMRGAPTHRRSRLGDVACNGLLPPHPLGREGEHERGLRPRRVRVAGPARHRRADVTALAEHAPVGSVERFDVAAVRVDEQNPREPSRRRAA